MKRLWVKEQKHFEKVHKSSYTSEMSRDEPGEANIVQLYSEHALQ